MSEHTCRGPALAFFVGALLVILASSSRQVSLSTSSSLPHVDSRAAQVCHALPCHRSELVFRPGRAEVCTYRRCMRLTLIEP